MTTMISMLLDCGRTRLLKSNGRLVISGSRLIIGNGNGGRGSGRRSSDIGAFSSVVVKHDGVFDHNHGRRNDATHKNSGTRSRCFGLITPTTTERRGLLFASRCNILKSRGIGTSSDGGKGDEPKDDDEDDEEEEDDDDDYDEEEYEEYDEEEYDDEEVTSEELMERIQESLLQNDHHRGVDGVDKDRLLSTLQNIKEEKSLMGMMEKFQQFQQEYPSFIQTDDIDRDFLESTSKLSQKKNSNSSGKKKDDEELSLDDCVSSKTTTTITEMNETEENDDADNNGVDIDKKLLAALMDDDDDDSKDIAIDKMIDELGKKDNDFNIDNFMKNLMDDDDFDDDTDEPAQVKATKKIDKNSSDAGKDNSSVAETTKR